MVTALVELFTTIVLVLSPLSGAEQLFRKNGLTD